ncbi:MAG TPA: hypothetical protein VME43_13510 [Bryobacteraceae bacterium]|nr:hypothetical protein [Bryobacteraceae bacterium]
MTEERRFSPNSWRVTGLVVALLLLIGVGIYMLWPAPGGGPVPVREEKPSLVDAGTRQRIDAWLEQNHLNPFGDAPGTHYTGGTPLYNEHTGERRDRYEYILSKHPELKQAPGRK